MPYKSYIRKQRIKKLLSTVFESGPIKSVIQSSSKLITVQVIAALLLFVINYFIIKASNDQIYGSYVSIMTWVNFFSVIVIFGMDDYFIMVLPKLFFNRETQQGVLSVLRWSLIIVLAVFSLLTVVLAILIYFHFFKQVLYQNEIYFFVLLLELSLLNILIAFFRGINKVVIGQVVDKLLRPGLMIVSVGLFLILSKQLTLPVLLFLQTSVLLVGIICMGVQLKRNVITFHPPAVTFDKTLKTNVAFLLISVLYLLSVRLDMLFLTQTALREQVGYYNLAVRMADVIGYPLVAMNLVVPTLLSKENANKASNIKKIIRNTSLIAFIATLVLYLPAILLGRFVLSFFGKNFIQGYWPMVILAGTYLISSVSQQMNGYLMVSGHQNRSLICLAVNALIVFISCWWLIPAWGLIGAAFSVLLGSIVYLIAVVMVYNKAVAHLVG